MFKKILIPTDGSEFSETVMKRGAALAKLFGAKVIGVHVFPPTFGAYYGEAVWIDDQLQLQMRETAQAEGNKTLERAAAIMKDANVEFESVLLEGDSPWKGIVDSAERSGCDLIVMAAHGRRGMTALLLGSETNRVLTHTKVPVLVYR